MGNQTHPDLFEGKTPIEESNEREQRSSQPFSFCRECERPGICGSENECLRPCVICGGEGHVNGRDHYDPMWDYEKYNNPFATCPSCGGSGLAKDMSYC